MTHVADCIMLRENSDKPGCWYTAHDDDDSKLRVVTGGESSGIALLLPAEQ